MLMYKKLKKCINNAFLINEILKLQLSFSVENYRYTPMAH